MNRHLVWSVVGAMLSGIAVGWLLHRYAPPDQAAAAIAALSTTTELFLRLVKMIIAPLVFTTLVAGIGHMENVAAVGRLGAKTLLWFLLASVLSLSVGVAMVQWLQPGEGVALNAAVAADAATSRTGGDAFSIHAFITHLVPTSIFDALARNDMLQIMVFAVFVGMAVVTLGRDRAPVMRAFERGAQIVLKVTGFVMQAAPLAIFASLAATVAAQGLPILLTYAKFVGSFYLSLAVLWTLLFAAAWMILGRQTLALFGAARAPALMAFSCASSEVAYPRLLEVLPRSGVPRRIVSFVLPLGYSFNLDGSMMYCVFATLFILQAHGVDLSAAQLVGMLALLLITSKGMAAVPRASLVVIMATLGYLGLPQGWIALVLAVDHLLDMGRSGTNVFGNTVAAAVVARWEGEMQAAEASTPEEGVPVDAEEPGDADVTGPVSQNV